MNKTNTVEYTNFDPASTGATYGKRVIATQDENGKVTISPAPEITEQRAITDKERQALNQIANSEYQNEDNPVGCNIWLDYMFNSKSKGGVLTSLVKKGLVTMTIVPMNKSDNKPNGISDSVVAITQEGFDAIQ